MEQEEHLNLDRESLKAITVPTRANILKVLSHKQQTLSDLSQLLGLSAPTLKEHLDVLEKVQMIQKLEEGRKWKYYKITDKGLGVLYPERRRIWITLSLLGLSLVGTAFTFMKSSMNSLVSQKMSEGAFEQAEGTLAATAPVAAELPKQSFSITPFIFPVITIILLIVLIYFLLKQIKRSKKLKLK